VYVLLFFSMPNFTLEGGEAEPEAVVRDNE